MGSRGWHHRAHAADGEELVETSGEDSVEHTSRPPSRERLEVVGYTQCRARQSQALTLAPPLRIRE